MPHFTDSTSFDTLVCLIDIDITYVYPYAYFSLDVMNTQIYIILQEHYRMNWISQLGMQENTNGHQSFQHNKLEEDLAD